MQAQIKATLAPIIQQALQEDIGNGDHSSLACIPQEATGKAQLLVKEAGILAGVELATYIFHKVDPELSVAIHIGDGQAVQVGDRSFTVEGPVRAILAAERLVLNFMQRMSAIATKTQAYVKLVEGTAARILDTRKTTPGIRLPEKWAVRIGGGFNHRFGLYDMIMLKDNHIDFAGGIRQALKQTHEYLKTYNKELKIEIEVRNMDELKEVLDTGRVDRILLDNFSVAATREAVAINNKQYKLESSGGINEQTVRGYAECGVDYISVGALTHSVKSMDLSLKAI